MTGLGQHVARLAPLDPESVREPRGAGVPVARRAGAHLGVQGLQLVRVGASCVPSSTPNVMSGVDMITFIACPATRRSARAGRCRTHRIISAVHRGCHDAHNAPR